MKTSLYREENAGQRLFSAVALAVGIMCIAVLCSRVMAQRAQGLGVEEAIHYVLTHWPIYLTVNLVILFGVMVAAIALPYRFRVPAGEPAAIGMQRFKLNRLVITLCMLPLLTLLLEKIVSHAMSGTLRGLNALVYLGCAITLLLGTVWQWVSHPTPERLHALATGDTSRINDERMQMLRGTVAYHTLCISLGVLIPGGMIYEMIFLGIWPIHTLILVVVTGSTLLCAWWYWNRKL
jgi:hypothetical protein